MLESTAENREPISSGAVYTGLSLVKSHWTFIALLSLARVLGQRRGKNSSGGPASGGVMRRIDATDVVRILALMLIAFACGSCSNAT